MKLSYTLYDIHRYCSGSVGAIESVNRVALPLNKYAFLDLGDNTALTRWWTAKSINADVKR